MIVLCVLKKVGFLRVMCVLVYLGCYEIVFKYEWAMFEDERCCVFIYLILQTQNYEGLFA